MQVKLPRKLLYERDGDATLHLLGKATSLVPAREKLYANFLLKIELTDTIVQRHVYFNVCTVVNWIALVKDIERDSTKSERKRHKNDTLSKIARLYRLFTEIASHFAQTSR